MKRLAYLLLIVVLPLCGMVGCGADGTLTGHTDLVEGKTTLIDAQVLGKGLSGNTRDLYIQSLQNTASYDSESYRIGGDGTIGWGVAAGNLEYGNSKVHHSHQSIEQPSGIFAGDDGYQIQVDGHTHLEGGLVTSGIAAEQNGNNSFITKTLTHSGLDNHSRHQGKALAIGIQASTDSNSGSANPNFGFGQDKHNAQSHTASGISTANLHITDAYQQEKLSGQSIAQTQAAIRSDIHLREAESVGSAVGKLANTFNPERLERELQLERDASQAFRQNASQAINNYVNPRQEELRKQIRNTKDETEKTHLYDEIYKLQYEKRFMQTLVNIVAGDPTQAITHGTLQLAATKMREESLANSRLFPGIVDVKTGQFLSNTSYESGYFDGVKLGGVRIDLDAICGADNSRCHTRADGIVEYHGDKSKFTTLQDAINPKLNKDAARMYGATGGLQAIEGGWYLPFGTTVPYKPGSLSDCIVESFAGTHDIMGGQMWGWYDKQGNTSRGRTWKENTGSGVTAAVAIPAAAPFAGAELISQDALQVIMQIMEK